VRRIRAGLKLLVLALLGASIVNPEISVGAELRCRIYLVDASASARVASPGALRPAEIIALVNADLARLEPGDTWGLASFGRSTAFQVLPRRRGEEFPPISELTAQVDERGSDALQALRACRAHMPDDLIREVVLFSDGLWDTDAAIVGATARALGVNLYCVPIGDAGIKDVRIERVDAPPVVREGQKFSIDVEVVSTVDGPVTLSCSDRSRTVPLVAGRRFAARLEELSADPVSRTLVVKADSTGFEDACPENNRVRIDLFFEKSRPRIHVLSAEEPSPVAAELRADFDVTVSKSFDLPLDSAALVLENFPAPAESEMKRIAEFVRTLGGGLVVLGGPRAYGRPYENTPLEEILPIRSVPGERAAIVFVLDASGSMAEKLEEGKTRWQALCDATLAAVSALSESDHVAALRFSAGAEDVWSLGPVKDRAKFSAALAAVSPGGPTRATTGLREALTKLKDDPHDLMRIVMMTDGEFDAKEPVESYRELGRELKDARIGLTTVVTGPKPDRERIDALGAESIQQDLMTLARDLPARVALDRQMFATQVAVRIRPHEWTAGASDFVAPWINRALAKPRVATLADSDKGPVAALWRAGAGHSAALTTAPGTASDLAARVARGVAARRQAVRLSARFDRGQVVIAAHTTGVSGSLGETAGAFWHPGSGRSGTLRFVRKAPDRFEAPIEDPSPGSYHIDIAALQGRGSVDVMCESELTRLGQDLDALRRAGRIVSRLEQTGPGSEGATARAGLRPWLAALALAVVLLEMALGAFWK
jgi:hypothetical protein